MNSIDDAAQTAENRNLFFSYLKTHAPKIQFSWGDDIIRQLPHAVQVEAFVKEQPDLLNNEKFVMSVVASFNTEATKLIGGKIGPSTLLQYIQDDKNIGVTNLNSDVREHFGF